jgi:hypothetical protein
MQLRRTIALSLVAAGLVSAAPAAAQSNGNTNPHANQGRHGAKVPSRVSSRVKRANAALDRVSGYIDDGNAAGAATSLKAVNTNLAAALKAAKKYVGKTTGPAAIGAVATADDNAINEVVSLFDGQDGATVDALATTLDAAVTNRDDAVAAIVALSSTDQASYSNVLDQISGDLADEIDSIDGALADDTLTDPAKTALNAARAKLVTAQTTVSGLGGSSSNSSNASDTSTSADTASSNSDCPQGQRGASSQGASQT